MSPLEEINAILAETGLAPTSLEELELAGVVLVPVSWDDVIETVDVIAVH